MSNLVIQEIKANAESTLPIPQLARAALDDDEHDANRFPDAKIAWIKSMDDDYLSKMQRMGGSLQ